MSKELSKCQNCGKVWPDDQVTPIEEVENLFERVAPGEPFPSGECPDADCRALCQPVKEKPCRRQNKPKRGSKR